MDVEVSPSDDKIDGAISNLSEDKCSSNVIKEGKAEVTMLHSKSVFYNPVQEFNRDLSVAVLTLFAEEYIYNNMHNIRKKNDCGVSTESEIDMENPLPALSAGTRYENGVTVLEALSASGLRSIRYAKEVPGIKLITANDISESAVETIQANVARNNVEHLVSSAQSDASMLMYQHRKVSSRFQAIDLDPYGCPSQFLDPAVQAISEGGLLLVTCTDMGVLAGNTAETCYSKYGAMSLKIRACHEMALRIVLQCIESHANRYGRYIEPILSVSADFYVRVFVRVYTSPAICKRTLSKLSMVYQCVGCESITLQPLGIAIQPPNAHVNQCKYLFPRGPPVSPTCEHCNSKHILGGPIWNGPLHDQSFVSKLQDVVEEGQFSTKKRMKGLLAVIMEELPDVCLYYTMDKLFSVVHADTMPSMQFRSALLNAGYRVSYSHAHKASIKTDAPPKFLWEILRAWVKEHPIKKERLTGTALAILSQELTQEVSFEARLDANPYSRQQGLSRFPSNPQRYWGPGTRAGRQNDHMDKSRQNQGRFKRNRLITNNETNKQIKLEKNSENTCEK